MSYLNVKLINLLAGRPVGIIHKEYADNSSIHPGERIIIKKGKKEINAVVDTARGLLDKGEIIVSEEVNDLLDLKNGEEVKVSLAPHPKSINLIHKKLLGEKLDRKELKTIMDDVVKNNLTETEIAYFVSGILKEGMTLKETADMTKAMVETGDKLNPKGKIFDKHSIGGIPGRTSPIIVSICSAAGLHIPKTSSRAITSPAGTADCMETICKVDFSLKEIKKIFEKNGSFLVWGGSLNLAPADDDIIKAEKVLGLDPTPQLLASVLSKHLAVGADYVLIHIPYGKNAKVNKREAKKLEKKFKKISKHFNLEIECLLLKTEEPYGEGVGPTLEMKDTIKVLRNESSCNNLKERSLKIAAKILESGGKAKKGKGREKAKKILESGKALKYFKKMIKAQKGKIKNLDLLEEAKYNEAIKSSQSGKIKEINIKKINSLARVAGCPLDEKAGLYLHKHLGEEVKKGEEVATIYAESKSELKQAIDYYREEEPVRIE